MEKVKEKKEFYIAVSEYNRSYRPITFYYIARKLGISCQALNQMIACGKLLDYHKSCELHEKYDCKKNKNAFNCKDCLNYIKTHKQGPNSRGSCAKNHKIGAEQYNLIKSTIVAPNCNRFYFENFF